ncbi:MAG: hypothetical protein HUK08_04285 [Bacteroidaceae bacterium]|nr:hypothetical protein [Bacteroidaceae bacterium]
MDLPQAFIELISVQFGEELMKRYLHSFKERVPVSIRLNVDVKPEDVAHLPLGAKIPWSERGYYLTSRPQFTLDPLLHAGAYYVQDASSQYLDEVMRRVTETMPIRLAADFCAAPGGKTLILKDYLADGGLLIANEYVRKRAWILKENVEKAMGCLSSKDAGKRVVVINNSADEIALSGLTFDFILCDVPCSGEGMFRKDKDAIAEWSMSNVAKCAELQREIVQSAWNCLRDGGVLVYSTCTFNCYEDEEMVQFITEKLDGQILIEPRKFIPGREKGEGQFMVAFRKGEIPAQGTEGDGLPDDNAVETLSPKQLKKREAKQRKILADLNVVPDTRETVKPRTRRYELDKEKALDYLRGLSLTLPADAPLGVLAVTYNGFLLGTVKNIGPRANNLYPQEWRIKHL